MTSNDGDKVEFSFGWDALKLLGQNLYSNTWAAISELVANGFDAGASEVHVYINAADKEHSSIELFDNGNSMNRSEMDNYGRVGRRRRDFDEDYKKDVVMGRKGIGKLAALYLSENYYLITKTKSSEVSAWHMKVNNDNANEKPYLESTYDLPDIDCIQKWEVIQRGTLIKMCDVNLEGLGNAAFESLERKLSNYFSFSSINEKQIFLCIRRNVNEEIVFKPIDKRIAFKNMAFIDCNLDINDQLHSVFNDIDGHEVFLPYGGIKDRWYSHTLRIDSFDEISSISAQKDNANHLYKGFFKYGDTNYPYELKGWIGIHSTIDGQKAEKNDPYFSKNKFYNPIRIRLYVRNKLAVENYLNIVDMNQTYVNFIEGEISFDLLDDNNLPDIATTNRQGLNENDSRVELLTDLVRKIIGDLLNKRKELGKNVGDEEKKLLGERQDTAKKIFINDMSREFDKIPNVNSSTRDEITMAMTNKIKGDVSPKDNYLVFISYSSYDKCISDFFYDLLLNLGAMKKEFFYTERKDYDDLRPLGTQIKSNIIDENSLLFFITSSDYKRSEYCLFEGGAGWATRSVSEYLLLSTKYDELPAYLSNGKAEFTLFKNTEESLVLDKDRYECIVKILNRIIEHINKGRAIRVESEITKIAEDTIPSKIEISQARKTIEDYMDDRIVEYWNFYVVNNEKEYIEGRKKRNSQCVLNS